MELTIDADQTNNAAADIYSAILNWGDGEVKEEFHSIDFPYLFLSFIVRSDCWICLDQCRV